MWDIVGDGFGLFDGNRILEVANFSLDEPQLEAVFFQWWWPRREQRTLYPTNKSGSIWCWHS